MRNFIYMLFLLSPCFLFGDIQNYVNHVDFMGEISKTAITEICRRYDLRPTSEGGGGMHVIRGFAVDFSTNRPFTIEEARRIAVECEEIYLETINGFRKARPYFIEFPMPSERVGITFFVYQPNSYDLRHEDSLSIFSVDTDKAGICKVSYEIVKEKFGPYIIAHEETFEEAQKIVHEERLKDPSLQKQLYKPSYVKGKIEKNPPAAKGFFAKITELMFSTGERSQKKKVYSCVPVENDEVEAMVDFGDKIAKEKNLIFLRYGDCIGAAAKWYSYSFSFVGSQQIDLPEAKKLSTTLMKEIIDKLHTSSEVRAMREYCWKERISGCIDPSYPLPINDMVLRVTFWDENNDRIMPPHIAQILFLEGKMQYFTCDPQTQKLVLIHEEPLDPSFR